MSKGLQGEPKEDATESYIRRLTEGKPSAEIDEETYWHYLEVLPPKFLRHTFFAFAEGMEPLRLFWRNRDRYFARQLSWSETYEFCGETGLRRDYWAY